MVKLISKPPFSGDLPKTIGDLTLSLGKEVPVTSIAPFQGQTEGVVLALGMFWPKVNKQVVSDPVRLMWTGRGRALLIGAAAPDLGGRAAVTDQTGAEAFLCVSGADVQDVLARLIPIDLRLAHFGQNATARTQIGHMTGSVTRLSSETIELRVMRSMAATLLHDVTQAAQQWTARA